MTYIFIAKWFGIVSVLLSLGILFNLEDSKEMARHMVKEESGYIMGGVLPIIFGSFSLLLDNAFDFKMQLFVTLISLGMVLLGVFRVFFATLWKRVMIRFVDVIPPLFGLFGLGFGLILLYVGFVSPIVSYEIALLNL